MSSCGRSEHLLCDELAIAEEDRSAEVDPVPATPPRGSRASASGSGVEREGWGRC